MLMQEEFPIGCEVALNENTCGRPAGAKGIVKGYLQLSKHIQLLLIDWGDEKYYCSIADAWHPHNFRSAPDNLKIKNIEPGRTECAKCRGLLKNPMPGFSKFQYCPKCEP